MHEGVHPVGGVLVDVGHPRRLLIFQLGERADVVGAALLASYYLWPAARPAFDVASRWKDEGGYWFSAISTGICGGLIPFLFLWGTGRIAAQRVAATFAAGASSGIATSTRTPASRPATATACA